MTTKELRELSVEELDKKIRDSRQSLLNLHLRKTTGQVEKTHEFSRTRREIARMLTLLAEKRQAAVTAKA